MLESAAQRVQPDSVEAEDAKRAGLMAAIRTAMREIGEDVTGSEPAPGTAEIHFDPPKAGPGLAFDAPMFRWHPVTARALPGTVNEVLERTGAVSEFTSQEKTAESQPRFSLLKPV